MKDVKSALRKEMKTRRAALAAAYPDAGERMAAGFAQWRASPAGATIAGFYPFGSEIDPRHLMQQLYEAGCRLALPTIVPPLISGEVDASEATQTVGLSPPHNPPPASPVSPLISGGKLKFHEWSPGGLLVEGPYGIRQPGPDAEEVFPDIILAPLLAFDRDGGRLGYGGGFYDRALDYLKAAKRDKDSPLQVWGVAFSAQEVARVPTEPHDQRLDAVLTEQGVIEIRKNP